MCSVLINAFVGHYNDRHHGPAESFVVVLHGECARGAPMDADLFNGERDKR